MVENKIYRSWSVAEHRRKMKAKAVAYKGGKCEFCGYAKSLAALDFHHSDPSKKDFALAAKGATHSWGVVQLELDKCLLLCSNCHREEHERLRSERMKAQKELARQETPERKPGGESKCASCGVVFKTTPTRRASSASGNLYCSASCTAKLREKASWPSDSELTQMVWEIPVMKLAAQLGVSDVAVGKRCRLRGIPTPPRGYWQKK